MKIRVVSQNWYRQYYYNSGTVPVYEQPDSPFWKINNFITIRNSFETDDKCAVPVSGENVLKLSFDDTTVADSGSPLILFDEDMARRIAEFAKRIDPAHGLFINCAAGISRSGAVGEVLNDYFNRYSENNEADREYFRNHNRQICGNPLVRRILRNVLFGPTFY
ncbi:MAG: hypothetical protein V8T90_17595 [Victivallales bacterium]